MKILGKDKPINVYYEIWDDISQVNHTFKVPVENTIYKNHRIGIASEIKTILSVLNIPTSIPQKSKLYFHSSSKFPRYKLENTGFERKIKEEKADFIVVNSNLELKRGCTYSIWESQNDILITIDNPTKEDLNGYIKFDHYYELDVSQFEFLEYLRLKPSKPLISDKVLNAICDNWYPDLTKETTMEIYNMLQASDTATRDLGLKLLASHNTAKFPLTSKCLAALTLMNGIARNVTVKNLFTSLGVKPHTSIYNRSSFYFVNNVYANYIQGKTSSPEDIEMANYILNYYTHSNNISPYYYRLPQDTWYDKNFKA